MDSPTAQEAMIYLMVIMSASDRDMTDAELAQIGNVIRTLPVFKGFDPENTLAVAQECQQLLQGKNGLEVVLTTAHDAIPQRLHETAYALAVEIAAADLKVNPEELRMLQILRGRLSVDPLAAAAIERAARARHRSGI